MHYQALIGPLWNWNYLQLEAARFEYCFNRTFMELKRITNIHSLRHHRALIGPLWNWNHEKTRAAVKCFFCFNRTFMELKHGIEKMCITLHLRFNRTFMELKRIMIYKSYLMMVALIGPLWNWNFFQTNLVAGEAYALIGPLWNWNQKRLVLTYL